MDIFIRKSTIEDLPYIMPIFAEARQTIKALGIDQWQNGYPSEDVIREDIMKNQSFCVCADGHVVGTFALIFDGEPTYDNIFDGEWKSGDKSKSYIAMHRVAIMVAMRGCKISTRIVNYACDAARALGRKSVRIDTHRGNIVMRKMLENHGFSHCGSIFLSDGAHRVAYEKFV